MPSSTCKQCDYCIKHRGDDGIEYVCISMPPALVVYPDGTKEAVRGAGINPDDDACIYWVPKANARH